MASHVTSRSLPLQHALLLQSDKIPEKCQPGVSSETIAEAAAKAFSSLSEKSIGLSPEGKSDESILHLLEQNPDLLYKKIRKNLCLIHLAAIEKRERLLDGLLFKYMRQNRCHFPYFLFPADFQDYQYLLERYTLFCKRVLKCSFEEPTTKLDPFLHSFLSMHLNVILSEKSIELESFPLVVISLLISIENYDKELQKPPKRDLTPESKYHEISQRLNCLSNIQIWLECCEPSKALHDELIERVKSVKASLYDSRAVLKIPARL